ncbi:MAG: iron(III) transport system permease protein [Clostridium sp.]|jgi:iron(III) transport system permease protein
MLPFAMPSSAIAINMINGFSGSLVGKWIILPLAFFVSALPLAVRSTTLSYERLNNEYIDASKNLGEYTISAFLYTVSNKPISIAMVNGIFEYDIGLAMAYGSLVLLVTFIGASLIKKLQILME